MQGGLAEFQPTDGHGAHSADSEAGDGSLAEGDEDVSDADSETVAASESDPSGCIRYMPIALFLSLWLVAWGLGSSLELLHLFYTAATAFRIPHSSTNPAASAEGGATESEAIVRAVVGAERQVLPHLRFLGLQRLATMVEYSAAHRCDIFSSEDTWRGVTQICAEQATRVTQELRALKQQTHVSYTRRADLGWPELTVNFLVSPLRSTVEVFDRCLVFLGQYDGRYEVAFSQSQPLVWALRYVFIARNLPCGYSGHRVRYRLGT